MSQTQKINRFKYIEAFSAVISCGSISAAAKHLGVSQPAVSQLIKKLEDSVGVPLFVRRNGVIYPTARAESLRDDVDDLLMQLDKIQMQLNFGRTSTMSTVRFSANMSITNELLPTILAHLHQSKPSISFYVNSLPVANMAKSIMDGNVDFSLSTKALNHANIVSKKLISAREVCVLPRTHTLATKEKLSIRDLKNQKMMMTSRTDSAYDQHRKLFHNHRVQYRKLLESPFATLSMAMLAQLDALSINNVLIAHLVCQHNDQITWRPIEEFDHETHFYLSMPPWLEGTPTEQFILDSLKCVITPIAETLDLTMSI